MGRVSVTLEVSTVGAEPENRAPLWADPILVQFVSGESRRVPVRWFVSDADMDPITLAVETPLSAQALSLGISYDEADEMLVYDGTPLPGSPQETIEFDAGFRLAADDGRT